MRGVQRTQRWDPDLLSDALEVVAAGLRAGLPPAAALVIARDSTEWGRRETARVGRVIAAVDVGAATGAAWQQCGDPPDMWHSYRLVGSVWDLATQTGGPLADAVLQLAAHLREEARLHGRVVVLAAGPRTSARLLTFLPLIGPVLALLVGVNPVHVYSASPVSGASVGVGLLLTLWGWRWSRRMVLEAARPTRYVSPVGAAQQ